MYEIAHSKTNVKHHMILHDTIQRQLSGQKYVYAWAKWNRVKFIYGTRLSRQYALYMFLQWDYGCISFMEKWSSHAYTHPWALQLASVSTRKINGLFSVLFIRIPWKSACTSAVQCKVSHTIVEHLFIAVPSIVNIFAPTCMILSVSK